jgi:hypothetical protein
MSRRNETHLFHALLSKTRIHNGIKQQPLQQLVTSHVKMTVSLGPQGTLVTGTKTELVTLKSMSEMRAVNLRL